MSTAPLYQPAEDYGTEKGLMACIWEGLLEAYVSGNPAFGTRISDDFTEPVADNTTDATAVGGWFIQDAAAGGTVESLVSTANPDGIRTLSATTGTDWFGIEAHYGTSATSLGCVALPQHSTLARGAVAYQTRVDLNTLDSFFIGLTEPIVEFLSATGTLPTTSDYIGFYRTDDGALKFVCATDNNGGTAVSDTVDVLTAAEMAALEDTSAFANLGFRVNVDGSVVIGVNGKPYMTASRSINPLALPIESLTPKYAILRGATGDAATVALPIDDIHVFIAAG
jgi:hypothetical protein